MILSILNFLQFVQRLLKSGGIFHLMRVHNKEKTEGKMKDSDIEKYITTDLVCETGRTDPSEYRFAEYKRRCAGSTTVETLAVEGEDAERESGRPCGHYVTISDGTLTEPRGRSQSVREALRRELTVLSERAVGEKISPSTKVLVAGLGNRFMAPDALGARCADKVNATRHVKSEFEIFDELGCSDVCTVDPGVLAETGIESYDLIKGAVEKVAPDLVIVVDALAARSTSRLATTVQLSDTGLSPGGGIGNRRPAIDEESLGCPVISIGVPTVVNSSTLIFDALRQAGIEEISPPLEKILDNGKSFFVSLNDSGMIVERLSDIISYAINSAFGTEGL